MKNNRKRLNNKGFTLIELLAVVVILAVVMGIAMSSVLSSMNNSRKGSLQNSAESTSQIFQNKYLEDMVNGTSGAVFGKYDFSAASKTNVKFYPLIQDVASDLNLSNKSYVISTSTEATGAATADSTKSFIAFDGEKIVTCLVAVNGGSYYVGNAAVSAEAGKEVTVLNTKVTFAKGVMFACSNETQSWE